MLDQGRAQECGKRCLALQKATNCLQKIIWSRKMVDPGLQIAKVPLKDIYLAKGGNPEQLHPNVLFELRIELRAVVSSNTNCILCNEVCVTLFVKVFKEKTKLLYINIIIKWLDSLKSCNFLFAKLSSEYTLHHFKGPK